MTDNEIIKALELCSGDVFCHKGNGCPYQGVDKCVKVSTHDAIDLINRQQAKIERLENSGIRANSVDDWLKHCNELRAEAYKEIIEKAKEKAENASTWAGVEPVVTIANLDDLLKEMG